MFYENLVLALIFVLFVVAVVLGYRFKPDCPKCKTKMCEMPPHGNREVYRCAACDKEWIQL